MRLSILILLLGVTLSNIAQTHTFKPEWKKGTEKVLSIVQVERAYDNDVLISDTTIYNEATIKVIKESKSDYTLEVVYENQALRSVMNFYDRLGEELEEYKDLKLIFSINKLSAEAELQNWEETRDFMNQSFDQITSLVEKKNPDILPYVELVFAPVKEMFKSKENVEAYMLDDIGSILTPFQHEFELNKAISKTESHESPFNPMEEVSATTIVTLKTLDSAPGMFLIDQEIQLDLSQFIEMMRDMVRSMAESMEIDEETISDKSEELYDFEMDMTNLMTIHFNSKSTWVEKTLSTVVVTTTDPKSGTRTKKEVISTTTVN